MNSFPIPVVALGPGSRQESDAPDYLPMPSDMRTYQAPVMPEPEEMAGARQVREILDELLEALTSGQSGQSGFTLAISHLEPTERTLLDQVLGEGEVSIQVDEPEGHLRIQESVFAGLWRITRKSLDGQETLSWIEVGEIPGAVRQARSPSAQGLARGLSMASDLGAAVQSFPGLASAPALLAEITDRVARAEDPAHVINLSLLPFSPEDGIYLDQALGRGGVSILSRGYGNCRITATGVARVWWVQYFNSQDVLILNTIEITDVPEVARAAAEDLEDSAGRLAEVLEWIG